MCVFDWRRQAAKGQWDYSSSPPPNDPVIHHAAIELAHQFNWFTSEDPPPNPPPPPRTCQMSGRDGPHQPPLVNMPDVKLPQAAKRDAWSRTKQARRWFYKGNAGKKLCAWTKSVCSHCVWKCAVTKRFKIEIYATETQQRVIKAGIDKQRRHQRWTTRRLLSTPELWTYFVFLYDPAWQLNNSRWHRSRRW